MDLGAYVDGITGLLMKAGVTEEELKVGRVEQTLSRNSLQGVSFEDAATGMCQTLGVEVAG